MTNLIVIPAPSGEVAAFDAVYPEVADPDMIPTPDAPVSAQWLANGDIRIRTHSVLNGGTLDHDEFTSRNPNGAAGVANGRQLIGHTALVAARPRIWMPPFPNLEDVSVQPFVWRLGKFADPYTSGGEGPKFFNDGFSHGNMTYQAGGSQGNSAISIDADPTNYHTAPPGSGKLRGSRLSIAMNYDLLLGVDASLAARMYFVADYDKDGLRQYARVEVAADGVAANDVYSYMYPFFGGDTIKPVGLPALTLVGDNQEKPGPGPGTPWDAADIDEVQFLDSADQSVMATIEQLYSQTLQKADGTLAAYARNQLRRFLVKDFAADGHMPAYGKYYAFGMSSDGSGAPTAFALTNGEVYESEIRIRTKVKASGPD